MIWFARCALSFILGLSVVGLTGCTIDAFANGSIAAGCLVAALSLLVLTVMGGAVVMAWREDA